MAPSPPEVPARALLREASLELARLRRIRGASHKTWRRIARAKARLAFAAVLLAAALAEPAHAGEPSFRSLAPAPVGGRATPALGDLDGDGDLDALVGQSTGSPRFFANTGSASTAAFGAPLTQPFGLPNVVADPTFADLDADGDLDVVLGLPNGNLLFSLNTGTTTAPAFFAPFTNPFGLANVGSNASPALVDVDGDGDLDAFVGNALGNTLFFENTGTANAPAFAPAVPDPLGLVDVGSYASPAFTDADGDGDLDAFVGDSIGNTTFFENTGTAGAPAFAVPGIAPFGLVDMGSRSSPAFADIDGDGDLDAFVGESFGHTQFMENTGTASAPAFIFPLGWTNVVFTPTVANCPAFADLDDDGDLDAFSGRGFVASTSFFENTGTANAPAFASPLTDPFGLVSQGQYTCPAFADIDGDGDLDAFLGHEALSGEVSLFVNTGTAGAPAFAAPAILLYSPWGDSDTDFADIDGDGDFDAFVGNYYGDTLFFRNTGTASVPAFAAPSTNPFGLANVGGYYGSASPTLADLDGDGDLDFLVGEDAGNTVLFRNTGTATAPAFAAPSTNPFGLPKVNNQSSPAFADIDADGDLDAFLGAGIGKITFLENVELGPGTCADGLDNDGDGVFDHPADPGCAGASDPNEKSALECDNGVDDDGDGKIDWRGDGTGDPGCASLTDGSEFPAPALGCGIGPELLLLAPLLAALRRRRGS